MECKTKKKENTRAGDYRVRKQANKTEHYILQSAAKVSATSLGFRSTKLCCEPCPMSSGILWPPWQTPWRIFCCPPVNIPQNLFSLNEQPYVFRPGINITKASFWVLFFRVPSCPSDRCS